MKRPAAYAATLFLLLGCGNLAFCETGKNVEDIFRDEGLITDAEYNAAKKSRTLDWEAGPVTAEPIKQPNAPAVVRDRHNIEIGAEVSHITYREPGVMKEKGLMYGIDASYAYRVQAPELPSGLDIWMLKVDGRFSYGQVDYDGALSDGTPYTIDNIDDYILEFRGIWGCDVSLSKRVTFTPYIGLGYRYLNDDPSFDPYSYEREQSYLYSPIGIEACVELSRGWFIGAIFEYDIFWDGKNRSHFSNISPTYNDLNFNQDEGYGIRGSIKLQKKGEKLTLVIEPFIRYWNIKQSDLDLLSISGVPYAYYIEPKNNSTEIGCKLAIEF